MRTRDGICVLLILLLVASLTACAPGDAQLIESLVDEWAREKGINPRTENGEVDIVGAIMAGYTVIKHAATGSTGDAETDAALGVLEVVYPIKELDKQTDQGLDNRDVSKIDAAIRSRPKDYHYHNARGVVLLAEGKQADAEDAFANADAAFGLSNPKASGDYGDQVNARDEMASLGRAIQAEDKNGTSDSGKRLLRERYCAQARWYRDTTQSSYYLNRATNTYGIDCSTVLLPR